MPHEIDPSILVDLTKIVREISSNSARVVEGSVLPLTGGFDTEVYAFSVTDNSSLPERLVLRMFKGRREGRRAIQEGVIHNAAADRGHKVPRVFAGAEGELIAGRPFLLMERADGVSLLSAIDDPELMAVTPQLMAKTQAGINGLNSDGLVGLLHNKGIDTDRLAALRIVDEIAYLAERSGLHEVKPLLEWLRANQPDEPQILAICHGDFHPGNIMVNETNVTGVIDWATVRFGHAEFDVAVTMMVLKIGAAAREDVALTESYLRMIDQLVDAYVNEYRKIRPLDNDLLNYYSVLRASRALVRILSRESNADISGAAPDGYAWGQPKMLRAIKELISESTGIALA